MSETLTDEMPDHWVKALDASIEALGWVVCDAHESAIVVYLAASTRHAVGADATHRFVIVGWDADGTHWGLSEDGATVDTCRPLGGAEPAVIAARLHEVLRTGRPEPRLLRHAIPYAASLQECVCVTVHPCGGIIPAADCPDHGNGKTPAMAWHWEANCPPTPAP